MCATVCVFFTSNPFGDSTAESDFPMSALAFSRASKIAPIPDVVNHGDRMDVKYTCHMAVMHWMCMALGDTQAQANKIVSGFAKAHCPSCKSGAANHSSINAGEYGRALCAGPAQPIASAVDLTGAVSAGDVLVTGNPNYPMHSMVVRQNHGADHVTIRGFNNFGTLGTGQFLAYDPVSRNITKDKYWPGGPGRFGNTGNPLYVVPYAHFARGMNILRFTFR